jgi:Na+-driven multidrug efflux pump
VTAAERVIFNTGVLYVRLIIVMAIGLFTTRIVLDALGETNYGIYTLVAGVVGMLAILKVAMSSTSMRYMSHSLGSGDEELISKTFNTTLFLHFIIGLGIVVFIEIGGYFMFKYFLEIPPEKVFDAKVVFHFMALTTFVAIIAVPYDAVINSHENLLALSVVDIIGAVLKLGVALYLTITDLNLLILYGIGVFLVQLIMRIIKQQYSVRKYKECKINIKHTRDKRLSKEIMAFSGWNLFGSIASISVTQARSILLNMFFGVKINASEGIAKTASGQVNTVSVSLTRAINPQLVKSEGGGDRQKMLRITIMATKFSVFLFSLIAIPVIIELPYLLNIWLKNVPEYAVIFTRLTLVGLLISKFTFEITNAIRAVGDIKGLTIMEAIIGFLNIPIAYLFFYLGYSPYVIYVISIIMALFAIVNRLYFAKRIANMNLVDFFKKGIIIILLPLTFSSLLALILHNNLNEGLLRLIIVSLSFIIVFSVTFWFLGMTLNEKIRIKQLISSISLNKSK